MKRHHAESLPADLSTISKTEGFSVYWGCLSHAELRRRLLRKHSRHCPHNG